MHGHPRDRCGEMVDALGESLEPLVDVLEVGGQRLDMACKDGDGLLGPQLGGGHGCEIPGRLPLSIGQRAERSGQAPLLVGGEDGAHLGELFGMLLE